MKGKSLVSFGWYQRQLGSAGVMVGDEWVVCEGVGVDQILLPPEMNRLQVLKMQRVVHHIF